MRIYVTSLGCKLNQSEMEALSVQLAAVGHRLVASPKEAELCVLNTCAVTHVAAQKSRQALRRLHRENPNADLVATGCYAELNPHDLCDLPGIELVVGNEGKERLAELVGARARGAAPGLAIPELSTLASDVHSRTRALVKIQDGCDNSCSYCIIRTARGPQRSRPVDEVLAEVRARLAAGCQEVVLTGVHIGAYGQDSKGGGPGWPPPIPARQERDPGSAGADLWDLAARILAETSVARLRLSSVEPWDLPLRALPLWDDPRLCRHLHLSLQSGCDATLRRMARRYTTAEFAALLEAARAAIPDLAVTTDVIVGFPGETERNFAESLAFVRAMTFARAHVFPYSIRPGTPAARMPQQVPSPVKGERSRAMRAVAADSERRFRQQFLGRTMTVLWEGCHPRGATGGQRGEAGPLWSGLTDNYLRVYTTSSAELANQLLAVRLVALAPDGLCGQIPA